MKTKARLQFSAIPLACLLAVTNLLGYGNEASGQAEKDNSEPPPIKKPLGTTGGTGQTGTFILPVMNAQRRATEREIFKRRLLSKTMKI